MVRESGLDRGGDAELAGHHVEGRESEGDVGIDRRIEGAGGRIGTGEGDQTLILENYLILACASFL